MLNTFAVLTSTSCGKPRKSWIVKAEGEDERKSFKLTSLLPMFLERPSISTAFPPGNAVARHLFRTFPAICNDLISVSRDFPPSSPASADSAVDQRPARHSRLFLTLSLSSLPSEDVPSSSPSFCKLSLPALTARSCQMLFPFAESSSQQTSNNQHLPRRTST